MSAALVPVRPWTVGVVVPARNEAGTIATCVASILGALAAASVADAHVVVVADACTDDTAARAAAALGDRGTVLVTDAGRVGAARRVGTDVLLARFAVDGAADDRTWLCSTDADTTVPLGWVAAQLRLAELGVAAVAGLVQVDDFAEHPPGVRDRYLAAYAAGVTPAGADPDRAHHHVHGANLGVRADAYRAVGGWSAQPTAEDHDLWRRLRDQGWRAVSSLDPGVTTSGRAVGRAPLGFAGHLLGLADPAVGSDRADAAGHADLAVAT